MKKFSLIAIFFFAALQSYCGNVQVNLITKDEDVLTYATSMEILDSAGKQIANIEWCDVDHPPYRLRWHKDLVEEQDFEVVEKDIDGPISQSVRNL